MIITPVAAESMGTRSMATLVETDDVRIFIDPAADLGEKRYGLPPHPLETFCLKKHRERILLFAQSVDVLIVTHYHHDHYLPDEIDLYRGKILLIKNPNQHINASQRKRAFTFLNRIRGVTKEVDYADGKTFTFGNTRIVFSEPVPHGLTERLGFVVQVCIQDADVTFLFTSDVQGPCREEPMGFILAQNPDILYVDGPATYLQGVIDAQEALRRSMVFLEQIIRQTKVHTVVIDHHLPRDLRWKEKMRPFLEKAEAKGVQVGTAAEMRGEEDNLLEARRRILYQEDPPT